MRDALTIKTRSTFLPFVVPALGEEEIAEVVHTLHSGWISTGAKVGRFEQEFAAFVGAPSALAVSSCTAALHLALVSLGVGRDDCVVTSPMTFCSTVNVIEHIGARPILVDVEPDTLNIAPQAVEAVLANHGTEERARNRKQPTERRGPIKAILPVHLYGHPCDVDRLHAIARDYRADIVEDAAHALPARFRGRTVGSWVPNEVAGSCGPRVMSCFSFYATKNLATAEGGMLIGPKELLDDARISSLHGMNRDAWKRYGAEGSWYYEVVRPGFKYNMTDIQASLGLHQLRRLPELQARRRQIVQRYNDAFTRFEELETPLVRPEVDHAWHVYALRLETDRFRFDEGIDSPLAVRGRFIEELRSRNIGTSVHFIPVHLHPYYREKYGYRPEDFPNAYRAYTRLVSLPLYPGMTDADVDDVIEAVSDVVERYRRATS